MNSNAESRRRFLRTTRLSAGALLLSRKVSFAQSKSIAQSRFSGVTPSRFVEADYTLQIKTSPIGIAPNRILSATTYNGQFPGPILRFKVGQQAIIDVYNETDIPEQIHWHGQQVPGEVDGEAEEGTPFIPARGKRRIALNPKPAGFRFYHTHNRAGADLAAGQYGGEVGPVYIEPRREPGKYDREVFLVFKEFEPTFSRGGDMAMDFLSPTAPDKSVQEIGESAMKASLAKGMSHGFEVGYRSLTINGPMLGHGELIRVKQGERVLFHILNGSATEIRSLALPGHSFQVVALDGNPVLKPTKIQVLWLGTALPIPSLSERSPSLGPRLQNCKPRPRLGHRWS